MTFPRTILLNTPDNVQWLRTTHLKNNQPPPFAGFVLSGNEDCPLKLELYKNAKPDYNEKPVMVYTLGEGKAYTPDRPEGEPPKGFGPGKATAPVTFSVPIGAELTFPSPGADWGTVVAAAPVPKPLTLAERLKAKGLR